VISQDLRWGWSAIMVSPQVPQGRRTKITNIKKVWKAREQESLRASAAYGVNRETQALVHRLDSLVADLTSALVHSVLKSARLKKGLGFYSLQDKGSLLPAVLRFATLLGYERRYTRLPELRALLHAYRDRPQELKSWPAALATALARCTG
jgi:hypothetical protein